MNFSAPFVIRPIATTLLMIGLTLLGAVAYMLLPIAGVPQADVPTNLPNPPTYDKSNPADWLLMSIAVTSSDLPISKVDEYVENYLAPRISRIKGVGLVDYHGQQKPAVRIQINPTVASAMGLSLEDVRAAITTATVNV